jgi:hypothetical protein
MINKDLGNAPSEGTFAYDFMFFAPYKGDQWFFRK